MTTKSTAQVTPDNADIAKHVLAIKALHGEMGKSIKYFENDMGKEYHAISILRGSQFSSWMRRQDKETNISESTAYRYLKGYRASVAVLTDGVLEAVKHLATRGVKIADVTLAARNNPKIIEMIRATDSKDEKAIQATAQAAIDAASTAREFAPASNRTITTPSDRAKRVLNAFNSAFGKTFVRSDKDGAVPDSYDAKYAALCAKALASTLLSIASQADLRHYGIILADRPQADKAKQAA